MKQVFLLALLFFAAACGSSKPADQQHPGQGSPGSPASAWTTTGGPATPGAPGTGSVETVDGGKH